MRVTLVMRKTTLLVITATIITTSVLAFAWPNQVFAQGSGMQIFVRNGLGTTIAEHEAQAGVSRGPQDKFLTEEPVVGTILHISSHIHHLTLNVNDVNTIHPLSRCHTIPTVWKAACDYLWCPFMSGPILDG